MYTRQHNKPKKVYKVYDGIFVCFLVVKMDIKKTMQLYELSKTDGDEKDRELFVLLKRYRLKKLK